MNPDVIQVGDDVLIACYSYKWSYVKAKVVRTTKTWIIVKREHDGAPEETYKKNNLRELSKSPYRGNELIIDPLKIKDALYKQERDKARSILENDAIAILDKLRNNIRCQSDELLNQVSQLNINS